jgi:hypothetical protein
MADNDAPIPNMSEVGHPPAGYGHRRLAEFHASAGRRQRHRCHPPSRRSRNGISQIDFVNGLPTSGGENRAATELERDPI